MLRKALIVITLLPAIYLWLITALLGIAQPFFAALVVGGLLGSVGLIRAGWDIGVKTPNGRIATRVFLIAGILAALAGASFLFFEVSAIHANPAPIALFAILALVAIMIVGVLELHRLRKFTGEEHLTRQRS